MMAFALTSSPSTKAFEYLRFVFEECTGQPIPAIFCKDFYAEEIQAEANGQSNSTFYTDTYAKTRFLTDWVCPNLNKTTITNKEFSNIEVSVVTCAEGTNEKYDPDFLPDLTCKTTDESNSWANGKFLYKSLINTNFVPAKYHSEQTLQKYATETQTLLSSD